MEHEKAGWREGNRIKRKKAKDTEVEASENTRTANPIPLNRTRVPTVLTPTNLPPDIIQEIPFPSITSFLFNSPTRPKKKKKNTHNSSHDHRFSVHLSPARLPLRPHQIPHPHPPPVRNLLLPFGPVGPVRFLGYEEAGDAGGADDEGAGAEYAEEDDKAVAELCHGCSVISCCFFFLSFSFSFWLDLEGVAGKVGWERRRSGLIRSRVGQVRGGEGR